MVSAEAGLEQGHHEVPATARGASEGRAGRHRRKQLARRRLRRSRCLTGASSTGRRAGSGSTSGFSSSPRTSAPPCSSGSGSCRSSPATWTSSSWCGWPAGSGGWPPGCPWRSPTGSRPSRSWPTPWRRPASSASGTPSASRNLIQPALAEHGIEILRWKELSAAEQENLHRLFRERIYPVLTPLLVDPAHPFPYISGLSLSLAVMIADPRTGATMFSRVKVPPLLPRFLTVTQRRFVPLEDVIAAHLTELFAGCDILEHHVFRVTRTRELDVDEDVTENLMQSLERELQRRPVRARGAARGRGVHVQRRTGQAGDRAGHRRACRLSPARAAGPDRPERDRRPGPASAQVPGVRAVGVGAAATTPTSSPSLGSA